MRIVEYAPVGQMENTVGEGTVAVVIENHPDNAMTVKNADGTTSRIWPSQVYACDWGGWLPDSLEDTYARIYA